RLRPALMCRHCERDHADEEREPEAAGQGPPMRSETAASRMAAFHRVTPEEAKPTKQSSTSGSPRRFAARDDGVKE
ncbi:MAG: hypothetical protein ACXW25_12500, partial [Rhodospirillales bacterium]